MTYQRPRPQPPATYYLSDDDYYLRYGYRRASVDQREPLISRVTNAWKDEKSLPQTEETHYDEQYPECCDLDSDFPGLIYVHRTVRSRRFKRMIAVILVSLFASYLLWRRYLYAEWAEDRLYMAGLDKTVEGFGIQMPNQFSEYTMVETLDHKKIPGGEHDPDGKRRLIFVGDIHGCNAQFNKLMDMVKLDPDTDHVITTGDIVGKGPEPGAVIDSLRKLGATVVRGNWDDRISLIAKTRQSHPKVPSTKKQSKEIATLSQLNSDQLRYLERLPLILHIPAIQPPPTDPTSLQPHMVHENLTQAMTDDIYVVHAGLVPAVPLSRQDPYSVMNMRAIHPFTHVPSADREKGVAWEKIWNWFQDRVSKGKNMPISSELEEASVLEERLREHAAGSTREQDLEWAFYDPIKGETDRKKQEDAKPVHNQLQTSRLGRIRDSLYDMWYGESSVRKGTRKKQRPKYIVYGHDSKRGLVIKPWTKGLDTGCVNGERLTALIVDAWGRQDIISIDCGSLKREDGT